MASMLTDTHCHLDYLKACSIVQTIEEAGQASVHKIITISVDPANLDEVIKISRDFPNVFCSQGIHPHDAKTYCLEVENKIRENCQDKKNKVVAIGEIGLDYHYNHSTKEEQINAFEAQLNLSCELALPLILHSREAESDTMDILKNFENHINSCKSHGVFHSFTSNKELAEFALTRNFFIGINGIVTFNKSQNVQEIVAMTPLNRLVVETDAPFLSPIPFRGKENASKYLPLIAKKIAEIKNLPLEEVLEQLEINATTIFKLD